MRTCVCVCVWLCYFKIGRPPCYNAWWIICKLHSWTAFFFLLRKPSTLFKCFSFLLQHWSQLRGFPVECVETLQQQQQQQQQSEIHPEICSNFCSSCFLGPETERKANPQHQLLNYSDWPTTEGETRRHATTWSAHCVTSLRRIWDKEGGVLPESRSPWRQCAHWLLCSSTVKVVECSEETNTFNLACSVCRSSVWNSSTRRWFLSRGAMLKAWLATPKSMIHISIMPNQRKSSLSEEMVFALGKKKYIWERCKSYCHFKITLSK